MTTDETERERPSPRRVALALRLPLFFVLFFAVQGATVALARPRSEGAFAALVASCAGFALRVGGVGALVFALARYADKRTRVSREMGLGAPRARALAVGALAGALLASLVFALEYALGWARVVGTEVGASGPGVAAAYALGWLVKYAAVGFNEELAVRGYLLRNLHEGRPLWLATLVSGALFGLMHATQPGINAGFFVSMVAMSALLAASRVLTGSLWFAVGWHASWDFAQTALGLASVGEPGFEHALLHLEQRGPAWAVGNVPTIEGGALVLGVELLGLAALLAWARVTKNERLAGLWSSRG